MPWWAWVLIGWAGISLAGGLLVGLLAAGARRSEREARAYRLEHPRDDAGRTEPVSVAGAPASPAPAVESVARIPAPREAPERRPAG